MLFTEYDDHMSSASTELGKKVLEKLFWEKLHRTEYGVRMSSVSTELGKRTGL